MSNITCARSLFCPGRLLVTPEALETLRAHQIPIISVMLRHTAGDWGCVSEDDKRQNDLSVTAGLRLLSIYPLPCGARIIVVTEWNRSETTIELIGKVRSCAASRGPAPGHARYRERPATDYRTRRHA